MTHHETDVKNITVKQSDIRTNHFVFQFGTFAKASRVMAILSKHTGGIEIRYHHQPKDDRHDVEIAVTFKRKNSNFIILLGSYLGVNLRQNIPVLPS